MRHQNTRTKPNQPDIVTIGVNIVTYVVIVAICFYVLSDVRSAKNSDNIAGGGGNVGVKGTLQRVKDAAALHHTLVRKAHDWVSTVIPDTLDQKFKDMNANIKRGGGEGGGGGVSLLQGVQESLLPDAAYKMDMDTDISKQQLPVVLKRVVETLAASKEREEKVHVFMQEMEEFHVRTELDALVKPLSSQGSKASSPDDDVTNNKQQEDSSSSSRRFSRARSTMTDLTNLVTSSLNRIRNVNYGDDYSGGPGGDPKKAHKVGILQQALRDEATYTCNTVDKLSYQLSNFEPIRHVKGATTASERWNPRPLPLELVAKSRQQATSGGVIEGQDPERPHYNFIIAMCTVSRSRANYLYDTVKSLLGAMTAVDRAGVRIVIYNADYPHPDQHGDVQRIRAEYINEIALGLITIVNREDISAALGGAGAGDGGGAPRKRGPIVPHLSPLKVHELLENVDMVSELYDLKVWGGKDDDYASSSLLKNKNKIKDSNDVKLGGFISREPNFNVIQDRVERTSDAQYIVLDKAKPSMAGGSVESANDRRHNEDGSSSSGAAVYASKISRRWGDDARRVFWRSKQSLDMATLLDYVSREEFVSKTSSDSGSTTPSVLAKYPYVLMLEDDIRAAKGFAMRLRSWVDNTLVKSGNTDWTVASFYNPWPDVRDGEKLPPFKFFGVIGQLVRMRDVGVMSSFLRRNFDQSPLDWLFVDYMKKFNGSMVVHTPSLFQHVGVASSLEGKDQPANAADFVGEERWV